MNARLRACVSAHALAAVVLVAPAAASAQDVPRTDPEIGSPAEAIYGIPLEEARRDGAPGAVPESTVRSENGVGSSSVVPGTARDRPDGGPVGGEPAGGSGAGRAPAPVDAELASARLSGEPSPVGTALLLILVLVLAAGGGALAARRPA